MKTEKKVSLSKIKRRITRRKRYVRYSVLGVLIFVLLLNLVIMPLTGTINRVESVTSYTGNNTYIRIGKTALISAHRAGGDLAPEETLMAFEECLAPTDYAVDIVEFDLHLTKDDHLVLLHDKTTDRTSNSIEYFHEKKVKVRDKTLAELKELNFGENFITLSKEQPYKGLRGEDIPSNLRILTLDEVLTYLTSKRGDTLNYIIEIKDGGEDGERATDILYQKMLEYDIVDRTIVGTFQANVTKYFDEQYPMLTRSASIIEVLDFYYSFLYNVKKDFPFEVLQIPKGFATLDLGSKSFIDFAHSKGISVQYWTINKEKDIRKLVEAGADVIITDNPKLAYLVVHGALLN